MNTGQVLKRRGEEDEKRVMHDADFFHPLLAGFFHARRWILIDQLENRETTVVSKEYSIRTVVFDRLDLTNDPRLPCRLLLYNCLECYDDSPPWRLWLFVLFDFTI